MKRLNAAALAAGLMAGLLVASHAGAQSKWPERPLKLVVPYVPGAMGDIVARLLAEPLRIELGQSAIVESRPGAGGNIGARAVEQAAPDGYTFLVAAANNLVINQFIYKDLGFDPLKRLEPVTILVDVPSVVFIPATVPAKNFQEFVAWARANPGRVNYASPGSGTPPHLSAEAINQAYKLGMAHVPYKGGGQAVAALLGNEVQFYLAGAGVAGTHVKDGRLRAIAVSHRTRIEALPDTPTFTEAGILGINATNWWGVAAPKGTPPAVINRMREALCKILADPAILARMAQLGNTPVCNTPAEMARQMNEEAPYWQRAVQTLGIKAD
mgnify:CR=1 FL=1